MLKERYDLDLSTNSSQACDAYIAGTDAILAATLNPSEALNKAIEADPSFALPHAALAREHQLMGRSREARASAEHAQALAESASERERQHVEIFRLMVTSKAADALTLTHAHLQQWPRDAFVLAPSCGVFGLIGFSGREDREPEQLALLEPLVSAYGDDWWFQSAYAFALLEMGQWSRAQTLIEHSLEQFPRNAHAAHIKAHALYEAGDDCASLAYLEGWLPQYPRDGLMHCHLWWHLGLMRLVSGDVAGTWAAYDQNCAPGTTTSPSINVMSDSAALLWRAELAGQPRPTERWQALREYTKTTFPKPMVFIDAHGGLPFAALDDATGVAKHIDMIAESAERGRLPAGTVGADLTAGFAAFANGDWDSTINSIEPIMHRVVCIGGSRAQRDLVSHTLLAAYIKSGRTDQAQAMMEQIDERQASVPMAGLN